ncbi:MAG: M48 family metalloprotease [Armatimonadota bacterium]|nr:M48 family metalloprotease [Armatimonadota bacterium]MDR5703397.1 M48 family metalloprotease [Armatimonadota bacterium]MDR7434740.1 M48 family metalloprotease [Armatimonadota bacterium]
MRALVAGLLILLFFHGLALAQDTEAEIGRRYAKQIESQYKVVHDPALAERVARIGREVAAASDRPEIPFTFKVLDLDSVNAVSLPGGFIYLTTGMVRFVRTDHELAAVLAHEIAHVVRGHGMEMIRRHTQAVFYTMLIAALTRDPNLAKGAQLVSLGVLSSYTREMEQEADRLAIIYLQRTHYTPAGLLTLMERLRWKLEAQPDLGAFADHPTVEERVRYIETELKIRGIPLARRIAGGYLRIEVLVVPEQGREIGELYVDGRLVLRLPGIDGSARDRIQEIARRLDRLFNEDLRPYEVSTRPIGREWGVFARGSLLIVHVTAQDAAFLGSSPREIASGIRARLVGVLTESLWQRRLGTSPNP